MLRLLQLREIRGDEAMGSERRRSHWGLYPGWLLNSRRKEKKVKYLVCLVPRGGDHGDLDDIDGEREIDDQAIDDGQKSACLC